MIKTLFVVLVCMIGCMTFASEEEKKTDSSVGNINNAADPTKEQGILNQEYDASKIKRQGRMAQANKRFLEGGASEEMRLEDEQLAASVEQQKHHEMSHDSMQSMQNQMMYEQAREQGHKYYDEYQKQNPLPVPPQLPLQGN